MADRRRKVKSDNDSEGSLSGSDVEVEIKNDIEVTLTETHEKEDTLEKEAEVSEYESVEEQEHTETVVNEAEKEESLPEAQDESLYEVVDEEGGEEGIAETEDVDEDFLSGELNDDASGGDSGDEEYVEEERQQGDGEECSPDDAADKELDFDEDRRNPQYIPKKGVFYEHDDRNSGEIKEKEEEQQPPRDRKKKLWLDEGKWGHDRFREEEQFPKSKNELIEAYGYDIRNEDGPPRARRRRRYGRGPSKYDRSWEDGTAYGHEKFKSPPRGGVTRGRRSMGGRFRGGPRGRGRGRNQYNSDNQEGTDNVADTEEEPTKNEESEEQPIINSNEFPSLPTKEIELSAEIPPEQPYFSKSPSPPPPTESKSVRTLTFENSNLGNKNSIERDVPPRRGKTPPFTGNHDRGSRRPNTRARGYGRGDNNRRSRGNMRQVSPRFLENKVNNLSNDMEQLSMDPSDCNENLDNAAINENNGVANNNSNELQNMALKGAGDASGRPKRYSSLRQRSLPETNAYQAPPPTAVQTPHPSYYETGYPTTLYAPTDTCVPTPSTQSQTVTSTPIMNPSYQTFTPPYTDSYGMRLPVTPAPRLFPQVSVPTQQPLMAPPPCITPAPNMMSFAPPPPPAGYQFAYQQYTPPPPPPPPAPANDMYQTGITYYYPQSHAPPVRPTVQKRPKAAIPILPPPDREGKRNDSKDSNQSNPNFTDNSNEPGNIEVTIRTDSSSQLQPTIGVES